MVIRSWGISLFLFLVSGAAFADCNIQVLRVSDGDTFHAPTVTFFGGDNVWAWCEFGAECSAKLLAEETGFRLARVYAPEQKELGYEKAKADLTELIGGKFVDVQFALKGKNKREKYGRFFVEVFLCEQGAEHRRVNVNDEMRRRGWVASGKGVPK